MKIANYVQESYKQISHIQEAPDLVLWLQKKEYIPSCTKSSVCFLPSALLLIQSLIAHSNCIGINLQPRYFSVLTEPLVSK